MLSKSQYIRGLQCEKSLWLYKNDQDLRTIPDQAAQSLFRIGDTVGEYSKKLFPGGVEIEFDAGNFNGMIEKTKTLIEEGADTIYEATFKQAGVFAMADILHKTDEGWNMYEVKASTSVKPYHYDDASIQWYALNHAIELNSAHIVHINNQYVREGELEVDALLVSEEVTERIVANQGGIASRVQSFEEMIKGKMPDIGIGQRCTKPYKCDFYEHCWSHVPESSVFNLYLMRWDKKFDLYNQGTLTFEDIPKDVKLSQMQYKQVDACLTGVITIDKPIIRSFLDRIEYPVSHFDFETFQNPVPRFDGQRPYMQIPFQYSLHIVDEQGGMTHCEFLGDHKSDPRRELSVKMLSQLPSTGSILAYNQSFEISRIKELADEFEDLKDELLALIDRFVDLIEPFRGGGYYHPDFNGSFSLKAVLPAIFPNDSELSYKSLKIQDGGLASDTFANLHLVEDIESIPQIREDLLAYCKLDTLAMVRILQKLQKIAG